MDQTTEKKASLRSEEVKAVKCKEGQRVAHKVYRGRSYIGVSLGTRTISESTMTERITNKAFVPKEYEGLLQMVFGNGNGHN